MIIPKRLSLETLGLQTLRFTHFNSFNGDMSIKIYNKVHLIGMTTKCLKMVLFFIGLYSIVLFEIVIFLFFTFTLYKLIIVCTVSFYVAFMIAFIFINISFFFNV